MFSTFDRKMENVVENAECFHSVLILSFFFQDPSRSILFDCDNRYRQHITAAVVHCTCALRVEAAVRHVDLDDHQPGPHRRNVGSILLPDLQFVFCNIVNTCLIVTASLHYTIIVQIYYRFFTHRHFLRWIWSLDIGPGGHHQLVAAESLHGEDGRGVRVVPLHGGLLRRGLGRGRVLVPVLDQSQTGTAVTWPARADQSQLTWMSGGITFLPSLASPHRQNLGLFSSPSRQLTRPQETSSGRRRSSILTIGCSGVFRRSAALSRRYLAPRHEISYVKQRLLK